ncbi:MAG: hypothetical protein QG626_3 [Patescibacteria group bacterium]|nr:hypothetical protein [Patescibacteria group bacterium]
MYLQLKPDTADPYILVTQKGLGKKMTVNFERIAELLKASGLDEQVVRTMVSAGKLQERKLKRQRDLAVSQQNLVHGLFTQAELIESLTFQRIMDKTGCSDFTWIGSQDPPAYTDDPRVVVVLEVNLADLASTVKFAYKWASESKPGNRLGPINLSKKRLLPSPDSEPFRAFTLRWRLLKLEEHNNTPLHDCSFEQEARLGITALFAAAQHPTLVKEQMTKEAVWLLPGLDHHDLGVHTIHLCFRKRPASMWLYDFPNMPVHSVLVIPAFLN